MCDSNSYDPMKKFFRRLPGAFLYSNKYIFTNNNDTEVSSHQSGYDVNRYPKVQSIIGVFPKVEVQVLSYILVI